MTADPANRLTVLTLYHRQQKHQNITNQLNEKFPYLHPLNQAVHEKCVLGKRFTKSLQTQTTFEFSDIRIKLNIYQCPTEKNELTPKVGAVSKPQAKNSRNMTITA